MEKKMGIHFGADYYPEHWPKERWETDAKLMKEMGLGVVRLAEFSWHKMEPEEGRFDFEWLDEAIDILGKYDIKTVLGTPTAAPPAWLTRAYPEMLPVDHMGIVHHFGGRHHDCQSNSTYRRLCSQMVEAMCLHYRDNENVIGWQIDNELGNSHDDFCHCPSCRKSFQNWLEKKYGSIDELNRCWGTAFWSQDYNSFDEIATPVLTATGENPSQMLDWRYFHSDLIVDFARAQADIIRRTCPNHFITHNCMDFADTVDYYKLGELLDFSSQDQYPLGYWFEGGKMKVYRASACVDLVRSFKKKPIWIMEQEAGITGWGRMGRLPKPGQLSQMALQSIAHGADCVVFFRWRSCAMGTEQFWHGILPHSGIPGRSYEELKDMIVRMAPVMEELEGAMPANKIAMVYSYRQSYAFRTQPQNDRFSYQDQMLAYYRGVYDNKMTLDFVSERDDLKDYRLVIAPMQFISDDEVAEKYKQYVADGGVLILTMRSGVKDEFNLCDQTRSLPGVYSQLAGIRVLEYDSLNDVEIDVVGTPDAGEELQTLSVKETSASGQAVLGKARVWADLITCDTASCLARYGGEFYEGTAAISINTYGKGKCIYVGCDPDEKLMAAIMDRALNEAGIRKEYEADPCVEISSRVKDGVKYIFVINTEGQRAKYSPIPGELVYGSGVGELEGHGVHIYKA